MDVGRDIRPGRAAQCLLRQRGQYDGRLQRSLNAAVRARLAVDGILAGAKGGGAACPG